MINLCRSVRIVIDIVTGHGRPTVCRAKFIRKSEPRDNLQYLHLVLLCCAWHRITLFDTRTIERIYVFLLSDFKKICICWEREMFANEFIFIFFKQHIKVAFKVIVYWYVIWDGNTFAFVSLTPGN